MADNDQTEQDDKLDEDLYWYLEAVLCFTFHGGINSKGFERNRPNKSDQKSIDTNWEKLRYRNDFNLAFYGENDGPRGFVRRAGEFKGVRMT